MEFCVLLVFMFAIKTSWLVVDFSCDHVRLFCYAWENWKSHANRLQLPGWNILISIMYRYSHGWLYTWYNDQSTRSMESPVPSAKCQVPIAYSTKKEKKTTKTNWTATQQNVSTCREQCIATATAANGKHNCFK